MDTCKAVVYKGELHVIGSGNVQYGHAPNRPDNFNVSPTHENTHYKWNGTRWAKASDLISSNILETLDCFVFVLGDRLHIVGGGIVQPHYYWDGNDWKSDSDVRFRDDENAIHYMNNPSVSTFTHNNKEMTIVFGGLDRHSYLSGYVKEPCAVILSFDGTKTVVESYCQIPDFCRCDSGGALVTVPSTGGNDDVYCCVGSLVKINMLPNSQIACIPTTFIPQLSIGSDVTPTLTRLASTAVYNNAIYCFGINSNIVKIKDSIPTILDPIDDIVTLGGAKFTTMDDGIHIIDGDGIDHFVYKDDNRWERLESLPVNISPKFAVALNGELHVVGGFDTNYNHYKYKNGEWYAVGRFPNMRQYTFDTRSAVVCNGSIYAICVTNATIEEINGDSTHVNINFALRLYRFDGIRWSFRNSFSYLEKIDKSISTSLGLNATKVARCVPTLHSMNNQLILTLQWVVYDSTSKIQNGSNVNVSFILITDATNGNPAIKCRTTSLSYDYDCVATEVIDDTMYLITPDTNTLDKITATKNQTPPMAPTYIRKCKNIVSNMKYGIVVIMPKGTTFYCDKTAYVPITPQMESVPEGYRAITTGYHYICDRAADQAKDVTLCGKQPYSIG